MLAYGGNSTDLFRGAFMQSGAPIPVGNMTGGQKYYDSLVDQTNCANSNDTLSCLRNVPLDAMKKAVDNTPNYFSYNVGSVSLNLVAVAEVVSLLPGFGFGLVTASRWAIPPG